MDSTTSTVSYRPYKSKRHSRTISTEPTPPHAYTELTHDDASHDAPHDASHDASPVPVLAPTSRPVSVSLAPVPTATNGHAPASPTASSSTSSTPPTPAPSPPQPRTSTFRRVVPTSTPHAPSPLRPQSAHALTVSPSFSRQSAALRRFDPQPGPSTPRTASPATRTPSPAVPARSVSSARPSVSSTPSTAASSSPPPPAAASPSPPPPPSKPQSPPPAPTPTASASTRRPAAPYRPGFQPKGVYRPRTDEFLAARSAVRDRGKVEQRRLERRLEKLIALHFPPEAESASAPEKPPAARRASSLFDLDFSKNPAELWRDVVEARMQRPKADTRAEEQSITPWEDDASVSHCPLCTTSFHPLTNRKHHCRLCGRIVCALPPRPPARAQTCSLLFVVDARTGRIDEVGEGVDYGVRRKGEDDRFLRGVRICRDCRGVLLRQQYLQDAGRVPTYARLYSTLMSLEKEIEDALPQFQELVLSLSTNSSAAHVPTAALRTRLLASFGEYDRLAKRIRGLPAPRGGSQDRVQGAILTRANLFLQKNMFPLQSLPKPAKAGETSAAAVPAVDKDSALAHALQPLLEQEALLEAFVEEARAQRKFEDARTLKASLEEIRAEIERVSAGV